MFKQILRGLMPASVSVCLLIFAVGCSNTQGGYGTGRDTTGTGTYGGGTYGGNQGTTTTGTPGTQGSMSTASVTDATALGKLKSADSSEVALAQYALGQISDSRVKDFAQMLIDDHQKDEGQVKSLIDKLNITPATPSSDSTESHMDHAMSALKASEKGQSFDAAFLQLQINDHQANIDALKAMQSMVTNDQVKNHINDVLPKLQQHLDKAQDLLKNLGMSQTGH